jgi:hypothetical protein
MQLERELIDVKKQNTAYKTIVAIVNNERQSSNGAENKGSIAGASSSSSLGERYREDAASNDMNHNAAATFKLPGSPPTPALYTSTGFDMPQSSPKRIRLSIFRPSSISGSPSSRTQHPPVGPPSTPISNTMDSVENRELSLPFRSMTPAHRPVDTTSVDQALSNNGAPQGTFSTSQNAENTSPTVTKSEDVDLSAAKRPFNATKPVDNSDSDSASSYQPPPAPKKRKTGKGADGDDDSYSDDSFSDEPKQQRRTPRQPRPANNTGTRRWSQDELDVLDVEIMVHGDDYAAIAAAFPDRTLRAVEVKVKQRVAERGWQEAHAKDYEKRSGAGRIRGPLGGYGKLPGVEDEEDDEGEDEENDEEDYEEDDEGDGE